MLPRPLRLMPSSPKRIFSTSRSSLLNALDGAVSSSEENVPSPFDHELRREKPAASSRSDVSHHPTPLTVNIPPRPAQWRPSRPDAVSGTMGGDSAAKLERAVESSTIQVLPCSAIIPRPKPISKGSKENGTIPAIPHVVSDPPLIPPLPTYSYKDYSPSPTRVYVRHEEEANVLVGELTGTVGFDLEWKVMFSKGSKPRPAATVQISDRRMILVIQISAMKRFPTKLKELLEDPKIEKVGANILNDGNKLARDYGVRSQGLVELGKLAQQADVHFVERYTYASELAQGEAVSAKNLAKKTRKPRAIISLGIATAMYTGRELPKGPVRCSNWETQPLSEMQLEYAANDAHSALMIYNRLIEMAKMSKAVLEPAKYVSGVKSDYGLPSGAKLAPAPPKPVPYKADPFFQAPMMDSRTTSSSSVASTSATSCSTISSASASTRTSTDAVLVEQRIASTAQTTTRKGNSSVAYAEVSDEDIEVLEVRVHHRCDRTTQTSSSVSRTSSSVSYETTSSSDQAARGRSGPRFKPSYDTLSSTNASRSSSPMKLEQTTGSLAFITKNPSPDRSPRFKPSYNTTASRSPSPVKFSTATSSSVSSPGFVPSSLPQPTYQRPQHIRAYNLWHDRQFPLPEICSTLRSRDDPLKTNTVITYVVTALQTDPKLHFSRDRLRALLSAEPKSWLYYRDWFHTLNVQKHVNMDTGPGK